MGLLYSKMKIFHFKDKLASLAPDINKILPPVQIRIKPTNHCGHNCYYCAYRAESLQPGKDMNQSDSIPKDKMLELIDDIIDMGVKSVTFSGGGDPFCYPYLVHAVKKLSDSPVKFASLTNGANLSGELAEVFATSATWLRISIDGWDDESYSEYRGVRHGEFTKVMNNIRMFKKHLGRCFLGAVIVVDKKNAPHVYESIGRLKDAGVDSVKVSPCIVSNIGVENNLYHWAIFKSVKEQTIRACNDFVDEAFEIFDSYHELDNKFDKDYSWCPYIQIVPVIGADSNVYTCHDKAYNLEDGLIGSVKDMRFKELWFSDKWNFFRINPSVHCNHHCVSNAANSLILEYINVDKGHLEFV
ncbi:radical SAM protein [Candidatus Magnetominusculus dajiuhuensis]|uniref:radical SAM protein n=1 Tax=Candidatus Magnetominusculus dajiuhuensis TaxID=3137712 RepID=UPI003B42CA7F